MRPVRFAPCAAGASPRISNCAFESPKPGTGLPQYSHSRYARRFSRATLSRNFTRRGHLRQETISSFKTRSWAEVSSMGLLGLANYISGARRKEKRRQAALRGSGYRTPRGLAALIFVELIEGSGGTSLRSGRPRGWRGRTAFRTSGIPTFLFQCVRQCGVRRASRLSPRSHGLLQSFLVPSERDIAV